jgi:hypothetical protein
MKKAASRHKPLSENLRSFIGNWRELQDSLTQQSKIIGVQGNLSVLTGRLAEESE